ncbi:MAG: FHA domain-containing protein [Tepidisphaeraceae bacterium]
MADEPIRISWSDLKTSKVEKHVRQQQAMVRNRRYAQMTVDDLRVEAPDRSSIWYNSIFLLAAFGLLGGVLAWTGGALMHLKPDLVQQADQSMTYVREIRATVRSSPNGYGITPRQADAAIHSILISTGNNPYLAIELDASLKPDQKQNRLDAIARADHWRDLITHIIGFGLCGLFISVCLSVAEPVIDRNVHAAVKNGAIGAGLGLLGGLAASLVVDRIYGVIGGVEHGILRQYLAQSMSWAVLGCFVAIAPGVVAKNRKRFFIGVAGGALGGFVGGILLDPFSQLTGSPEMGRLAAICCIGLVTGAATGIIERAARTGWLRVTAGVIKGKQFILYRNPTYIGSAPDCQIYLFRDPKVGRRHAAIHLLKGRIEIEDLPLGGATLVNSLPITRRSLRQGDQISIGATKFLFQEKTRQG